MAGLIRWGILGTGRMAASFASAFSEVGDARLHGVASRRTESAGNFADKFNIENAYASYAELVTDDEIDIVYIATPHSCHYEHVKLALDASKAVLCEKPFTLNAKEAEKLIYLARRKKLFLMEAMWTRYIPAVVKLRELLSENAIGEVQLMLAGGAFMPEYDPDFYLFRPDLGGGVLLDAGVYLVSIASMLFGSPVKVQALAAKHETGVDEHDTYIFQHEKGELASMYVSLRGQHSPDLTLLGSKGKIYLHAPVFCPSKIDISLHEGKKEELNLPFPANGYQFEIEEVNSCLISGQLESRIMPLDETLEIMKTMDNIRELINVRYPGE